MKNMRGKGLLGLFFLLLPTYNSQTISCCHGDVRLVNGYTPNEGRVEVCLSNQWNTICNRSWGAIDAGVVCVQLGFMRQNAQALTYGSFGSGSGSTLDYVLCSGTEMALTECTLTKNYYLLGYCTHSHDAGLRCAVTCQTGAVRLQDGSRHGQGRVEVCYNGAWGTVCDDYWDSRAAKVVCRQLGFSSINAQAHYRASHDAGSGAIHIEYVRCSGEESSLLDCSLTTHFFYYGCSHYQDASVTCQINLICQNGDVRLVNGNSYSGRVEVCLNETWGTICDNGWQIQSANIICRQLGYTGYHNWYLVYVGTSGAIYLTNVYCKGNEASLLECNYSQHTQSCSHYEDVGVQCLTTRADSMSTPSGEVRLIGGLTKFEGVVKISLNGTWQHICFDGWNESVGRVVCRQLGYLSTSTNVTTYRAELDMIKHSNILKNVTCSGTESHLTSCCAIETGSLYCSSQAYAGVRCGQCTEESLRLVNGPSQHEGRLEICLGGGWGTICDNGFGRNDAIVACRQLGFLTEGSTSQCCGFYGQGTTLPIAMNNVGCTSTENKLAECPYLNALNHSCGHSEDVGVTCQKQPTAAPTEVQGYTLNSSTIFLLWSPPPVRHQNGIIKQYYINVTNVISGDRETITTIATHLLFQNGKPNSTYSFTVAAYTVALGPASEPTVVNTEPNINGSNELDLQCRDKYGSELKIMPTTAALGALNGVFAAIVIVLGIVCICVLACFYHNYIKKKISGHEEQSGLVDSNKRCPTGCELKLSPNMPESMKRANSQVSLNRVTDPNSNSFELLETKNEYSPDSPPPADESNIYQPLSLQKRSEDATSSEYQSLTHNTKERATPRSPVPSKENEYQNLPRGSKHHPLSKQRELCFEDVVIKKRKS